MIKSINNLKINKVLNQHTDLTLETERRYATIKSSEALFTIMKVIRLKALRRRKKKEAVASLKKMDLNNPQKQLNQELQE